MDHYLQILPLFPMELANLLAAIQETGERVEEIRVRLGEPLRIKTAFGERELCSEKKITEEDLEYILRSATSGSFHAFEETIQKGYIPLEGGGRLGLCGQGIRSAGKLQTLRNISSLCIRIPHEMIGCADGVLDALFEEGYFPDTLVISPPGIGKTTLLREMVRALSQRGYRVALADERGEIAGMCKGRPQYQIGAQTDVLSNINKCEAGIMLLRTMAPDILAMDEITAAADMPAILEAAGCGVALLSTVHGRDPADLKRKPLFADLLTCGIFEKAVCIELCAGKRIYRVVDL